MATTTNLSPGVIVKETDLTNAIPNLGTSGGATVGNFSWGPVDEVVTVSNATELQSSFGKPNDQNFVDWFSAFNFLSYTGNLKIVRVADEDAKNASSSGSGVVIKNSTHFEVVRPTLTTDTFAARYIGTIGNGISVQIADASTFAAWAPEYKNLFDGAPGTSDSAAAVGASNDELHVLVIDKNGSINGIPGEILERFSYLSKALDAIDANNAPNYYLSVLNRSSKYVWGVAPLSGAALAGTEDATAWGVKLVVGGVPSEYDSIATAFAGINLLGGVDSTSVAAQEINGGLDMFENSEQVPDVSLIFLGAAGGSGAHTAVVQHAIDNIAEARQDCMVFFSPLLTDVLNKTQSDATTAILATRTAIGRASSYAVMDSGWKLQYDAFNDKMRWIPMNADIAGICARTDNSNDPWWSPGGYTRGQLKNVVSVAFNPNKASRDSLYKQNVNPVVQFGAEGTVLYGDKTLQGKNSAFSYIGIRRLFIVLRKRISEAAKYSLFEFNDQFTRANFINMVEPYLREVHGRRGMESFRLVCDTTNNTPEVIQSGEFKATIFIKPQYSIQWVALNFVAVRRDVEFDEVAGVA